MCRLEKHCVSCHKLLSFVAVCALLAWMLCCHSDWHQTGKCVCVCVCLGMGVWADVSNLCLWQRERSLPIYPGHRKWCIWLWLGPLLCHPLNSEWSTWERNLITSNKHDGGLPVLHVPNMNKCTALVSIIRVAAVLVVVKSTRHLSEASHSQVSHRLTHQAWR